MLDYTDEILPAPAEPAYQTTTATTKDWGLAAKRNPMSEGQARAYTQASGGRHEDAWDRALEYWMTHDSSAPINHAAVDASFEQWLSGRPVDLCPVPAYRQIIQYYIDYLPHEAHRPPTAYGERGRMVQFGGDPAIGRPAKAIKRKVRTYYATDAEYAAMQAKAEASGTDLSGLIRRAVLGQ